VKERERKIDRQKEREREEKGDVERGKEIKRKR